MFSKINAWLHLWLGLASGIIVVFLSITGCILVFEQEIRSLTSPWLHAEKPPGGTQLAPSELHRSVAALFPGRHIESVWYHGETRTAHLTVHDSDSMFYVNPYTAEVVAMVDHEDFFHEIEEGHRVLWLPPEVGRPIIGWATFIFFLLLLSGVVLWWPKKWNRAGRNKAFKIKWKARFKRVNYDLHNVLGFYSLLLAVLMAITGLIMSFSWFGKGVYWLTGGEGSARGRQKTEVSGPSIVPAVENADRIWHKVTKEIALYNKDQVIIHFAEEPDEPIYACTDMANGFWRDLTFDPATLELLPSSNKRLSDMPFADQVRKLNYSLHVGATGGLLTKILYFLASLICASLPVTGFFIWWNKRKKPKVSRYAAVLAFLLVTNSWSLVWGQSTDTTALTQIRKDSIFLNSVTITVHKKQIEQDIDKTVLHVENSILAEGNTALELLERAPGVTVDQDGLISLKGKPGVMVMINGKSTYLSPSELSILLKATNSSSISKIEIMTNPSAKYDAAGTGGIINIRMKKNMATGFNGTVSLNGGAGRNARYGSGLNLNYRSNRMNVFGSYDYAYRGETEYLDFVRRFYDSSVATGLADRTSDQYTRTNEPLYTHNFRVGLDYHLNAKSTLGFLINGNIGQYTHDSKTTNRLTDQNGLLLSDMFTSNYDEQSWENLTYNLNYLYKFSKTGRELSADADFAGNRFTSRLNLNTVTVASAEGQPETNLTRKGYVPAVTDVYLLKVDYIDPLTENLKLESGLKSSFTSSDNNLRYDVLNDGNWEYDSSGSNHFRYEEQIHAGYVNFQAWLGKFSVQVGLRGEYTRTEGHQITTDMLTSRSYFQLFPSVVVNRDLGEDHQFQAAYSRRIERPDYGDLNPFRVFRDPLLFYQGNPLLKPELINSFQLSHSFKSKYTTALSYSRTSDVMTWMNGQIDSLNTTFEMPQNLSSLVNYGISFTASVSVGEWWTATHFANVFHNAYKGTGDGGGFNRSATSFSLNSQNTFRAGAGYSMELNGFYDGGSVYGISRYRSNYMVSAGVQKLILGKKATLKLLINDIFQSRQFRERTLYGGVDMNTHVDRDSRRAMLSLSYRFGNQNLGKRGRRTGSEDIQNRIKGGG